MNYNEEWIRQISPQDYNNANKIFQTSQNFFDMFTAIAPNKCIKHHGGVCNALMLCHTLVGKSLALLLTSVLTSYFSHYLTEGLDLPQILPG